MKKFPRGNSAIWNAFWSNYIVIFFFKSENVGEQRDAKSHANNSSYHEWPHVCAIHNWHTLHTSGHLLQLIWNSSSRRSLDWVVSIVTNLFLFTPEFSVGLARNHTAGRRGSKQALEQRVRFHLPRGQKLCAGRMSLVSRRALALKQQKNCLRWETGQSCLDSMGSTKEPLPPGGHPAPTLTTRPPWAHQERGRGFPWLSLWREEGLLPAPAKLSWVPLASLGPIPIPKPIRGRAHGIMPGRSVRSSPRMRVTSCSEGMLHGLTFSPGRAQMWADTDNKSTGQCGHQSRLQEPQELGPQPRLAL